MDLLNVRVNNEWVPLPAFVGPKGDPGPQGDPGDSGVYYGSSAPSDPSKTVWINPTGEAINVTDNLNEVIEYLGNIGQTAEAFTSKEISHPRKITFIGNEYSFSHCRIADRPNLHKNETGTVTSNGITLTKTIMGFNKVEGATTLTYNPEISVAWANNLSIPAGTYRIFVDIDKGSSTIGSTMAFKYNYKYEGEDSYATQNISLLQSGYVDVTFTKKVIALNPRIVINRNYTYNNFVVWFGLYSGDVSIINIDHTVNNGQTYQYTYEYYDTFETIDTMQHKSIIDYLAPSNKVNAIVTPEMFGAVGDGNTDDTSAVQNCINYAITNKCVVVGRKQYHVKSTIYIYGDDGLFIFNRITTWDTTDYAVQLYGLANKVYISYLLNTTGKGFRLTSYYGYETLYNYINIGRINTKYNCIDLEADDSLGSASYISYNTFNLGNIRSNNTNCIACVKKATENYVYNAKFRCPNGWAIYNPTALTCYSCSFEGDVYGGIYADYGATGCFYGFRHVELTDKLSSRHSQASMTGGTLVKFVGAGQSIIYESARRVPYQAIDTSEMTDVTDPNADVDPPESWSPSHRRFHWSIDRSVIKCQIDYAHFNDLNGGFAIGSYMTVMAGKKICKPDMKVTWTVDTESYDMRDTISDIDFSHNLIYATKFIIDAADCVIHLASSYCCKGYDEFIVDQSDPTKLCTIYNSYDSVNPIFDGQALGAGIYKLTCECDFSKTREVLPEDWDWTTTFYTGYNDKWTVERIGGD